MSEKRFSVRLRSECDEVIYSFFDGDKPLDVDMIVDLLNEQQATIEMYQRREDSLKKTDFDFTIKQGELITKFSLGEDKILFETTQDYETIQTLSKWLYSMYDEIQKLKKELKWKREEIKALIEESERDE